MKKIGLYVIIAWSVACSSQKQHAIAKAEQADVLVIGGGASGIAAGLQSARLGATTIIIEENEWLGGMITAAGVSAFDGNHNLPSGIWAEFRQKLYDVYGGPNAVATGWVSNTLFEPHVGDSIFKRLAAAEKNLSVKYLWKLKQVIKNGNKVEGAIFTDASGAAHRVTAKQTIDATELGDVLAAAGIPHDIGMEAGSLTGEDVGVNETNDIIQDLTWVATLKDYGSKADCTITKPAGYYPMEFDGCCIDYYSSETKLVNRSTAKQMIDYGKLPNGKYMINWPAKGNDIYLNIIEQTPEQREKSLLAAKQKTLRFVYFIQHQLGFKNLGLAWNEFKTTDGLAIMPYYRESRRVKGLVRLTQNYLEKPYDQSYALYRTGIAVGDYPIDHHHKENPKAPQHLSFHPIPSFNVPLGALIPQTTDGLVIAEKSISVSNVVNGTTRLQPIVLLIGQAAGTVAAIAAKNNLNARDLSVRTVQSALLKTGAYLMPYYDVQPSHPHFISIQKIGATGILRGVGEPYKWANRTWFYPDSLVYQHQITKGLSAYNIQLAAGNSALTINDALAIVRSMQPNGNTANAQLLWEKAGLSLYNAERKITRAEFATLLDELTDVFGRYDVSHTGEIINKN